MDWCAVQLALNPNRWSTLSAEVREGQESISTNKGLFVLQLRASLVRSLEKRCDGVSFTLWIMPPLHIRICNGGIK